MQLHALDKNHHLISALSADKQCDYYCLECHSIVHLRGGMHRQKHFYHTTPERSCHLDGKSMTHLQVQCAIKERLPGGECELEMRFPQINRIADVVWIPKKLIFEVQCSSISAEEIAARNRDYASLGYQVVWILHDQRYNKKRVTAAEHYLRKAPHYFTNINIKGMGDIYDQYDVYHRGVRNVVLDPLPINLSSPIKSSLGSKAKLNSVCRYRLMHWPIYFEGDLMDGAVKFDQYGVESSYLREVLRVEGDIAEAKDVTWIRWVKFLFNEPYRIYILIFRIMLERACR